MAIACLNSHKRTQSICASASFPATTLGGAANWSIQTSWSEAVDRSHVSASGFPMTASLEIRTALILKVGGEGGVRIISSVSCVSQDSTCNRLASERICFLSNTRCFFARVLR